MSTGLPRIAVQGDAQARGRDYGRQAAGRIAHCIDSYRQAFLHRAGLRWDRALSLARGFEADIAAFHPAALAEMRGIAEGAGVPYEAILALNCRSELMFSAGSAKQEGECTAFAVLPEASEDGHLLVGQNWDWVAFAREVCVQVEARRDDGPDYVTVVEAGMLAKVGFNAAGLAVFTNTLVSSRDAGRRGVPYHVILRALLDAETLDAAVAAVLDTERALSANYLLAHAAAGALNVETTGGGRAEARVFAPAQGRLAHANHFLDAGFAAADAYVGQSPHSLTRLASMRAGLDGGRPSLERLRGILRGHDNPPNGICSHPDPAAHPMSARTTVASFIADLTAGEVWIADGPPCEHAYVRTTLPAAVTS